MHRHTRPSLPPRRASAALIGLLWAAAAAAAPPPGPPAMPVEATAIRTGTVNVDITAVGTLTANESVMIRPEIIGRVAAIRFEEGQWVEKGATLVELDASEYRARLDQSTAAVKLARLSFNRAEELYKKKLASLQQYDEAAAKLAEAVAQQALYREQLAKTVLTAPFGGVLGLRQISPGAMLQPGQDIVNLEDIRSLKLDFRVPERYLSQLRPDLALALRTDAFPALSFGGTLYAIAPGLEVASRTVLLRARVPNPEAQLRPGMFARVSLRLAQRPDALLIPEESLWPMGHDQFVYRVVDGHAQLVKVKTGHRRGGEVEILEGIHAGDLVITAGQTKIRDGAPVTVLPGAPPAPPG